MSNNSKRQFVRVPWQFVPDQPKDESPSRTDHASWQPNAPLSDQASQQRTTYPTQPSAGEGQGAGILMVDGSTQQISAVPITQLPTEQVPTPALPLTQVIDTLVRALPTAYNPPAFSATQGIGMPVQALPIAHNTPPSPMMQPMGMPVYPAPPAYNSLPFSAMQPMGMSAPVMPIQAPVAFNTPSLASRIAMLPEAIRGEVEHHTEWLQRNNALQPSAEALQVYQDASMEIKKIGKSEVRIFAPFQLKTSALRVITPQQVQVLIVLALAWGVGLFFLHLTMVAITLGMVTLLYILGFITSGILATSSFKSSSGEKIDEEVIIALDKLGVEWPSYTILCPLYKETAVVPQFVEAMRALNYPGEKLQVLFLTEENDKETRAALYAMNFPENFVVLTVPQGNPQTKPRACNFGLLQAKGQFVVIFDAEDKPEPYQLKKAILTFANQGPTVACVQAKLNFYNPDQNLLTRWFTAEYSTWFDILLPGLQRSGFSLPLGGTSNHFRTEVLRALGGWDAFNVTEDCDLGLRIAQYGLQTAVLDSTTYEEATSRYKTWIYQRSRWIKGYLQTYLVHMRNPMQMLRRGHFRKFLSLQIIVGVWSVVLLINPIMWMLTIAYVIFHPVQLYMELFPGLVLYAGAFCLIFGNFFYIYVHIIGCLRRKEYTLIKWVILLPLYWIMMSISAYIAFYQLIVKPHYWEKTQHGNHLATAQRTQARAQHAHQALEERSVVSSMPTGRIAAIRLSGSTGTLDSTTRRVSAVRKTLSTQLRQRDVRRSWAGFLSQELWLVAVIFIASATSITACWYLFQQHQLLLYSDGLSHMQIARMVFDSQTPGLAQLGGNWLPLPQILMWPFIWNDYLWRTGLAGSFGNMFSYVVASAYLFLLIRCLTKRNGVALIGALFFIYNPNILYFQSTPLSDELVSIATGAAALYYFLRWVKEDKVKYLIFSAGAVCLGTLARYDGWPLFAALLCLVAVNGLFRKQKWKQIQGNVLVFGLLGGLGILLWFAWDKMLFGDPLYFQHGPFSAQAQQLVYFHRGQLESYHSIWKSIKLYFMLAIDTVGLVPVILLGVSVLTFVFWGLFAFFKQKDRTALVVVMIIGVLLIPFAFYVESLYSGQAIIWIPGATPPTAPSQLFNTRYGIQTVAPIAVFLAILVHHTVFRLLKGRMLIAGYILCALLVLAQAGYTSSTGIIAFETGLYGTDCMPTTTLDIYMAEHYNGGNVLMDLANPSLNDTEDGIDLKNVVYEGSGTIWAQALRNPFSVADWVVAGPGDLITGNIKLSYPPFSRQFTLVASYKNFRLYHKVGLAPLPTRALPTYFLDEHRSCTISKE